MNASEQRRSTTADRSVPSATGTLSGESKPVGESQVTLSGVISLGP